MKFKGGDRVVVTDTVEKRPWLKHLVGKHATISGVYKCANPNVGCYDIGEDYIIPEEHLRLITPSRSYLFSVGPWDLTAGKNGSIGFYPRHDDSMIALADAYNIVSKKEEFLKYCELDAKMTEEMWTKMNSYIGTSFKIKNVIFNDPATIVYWSDGSKTVVKCQDGEAFDPEKGLAMAISKKALGNKHEYYHTFLHWLKKYEKEYYWKVDFPSGIKLPEFEKSVSDLQKKVYEAFGLKKDTKREAVQKAYDILVKARDGDIDYSTLLHPIEEAIGYLGEALED